MKSSTVITRQNHLHREAVIILRLGQYDKLVQRVTREVANDAVQEAIKLLTRLLKSPRAMIPFFRAGIIAFRLPGEIEDLSPQHLEALKERYAGLVQDFFLTETAVRVVAESSRVALSRDILRNALREVKISSQILVVEYDHPLTEADLLRLVEEQIAKWQD